MTLEPLGSTQCHLKTLENSQKHLHIYRNLEIARKHTREVRKHTREAWKHTHKLADTQKLEKHGNTREILAVEQKTPYKSKWKEGSGKTSTDNWDYIHADQRPGLLNLVAGQS
jgi:hypothetical protein